MLGDPMDTQQVLCLLKAIKLYCPNTRNLLVILSLGLLPSVAHDVAPPVTPWCGGFSFCTACPPAKPFYVQLACSC